jgi:hypothetical protein
MRQHKILTRTLLLLSIINFALAAPAAVRERPEVRLDANVTRNVTAASQKRSVLRQMAEHMEQDRSIDRVGLCAAEPRVANRVAGPDGRLSSAFPASPRTVRVPFSESARLPSEPRRIVVNSSPADAAIESDGRLSSASPRTVRRPLSESARLVGEPRHIVVNRPPADAATEPDGRLSFTPSTSPRAVRGQFSARFLSELRYIVVNRVNRLPADTATEPRGGPGNTFSTESGALSH